MKLKCDGVWGLQVSGAGAVPEEEGGAGVGSVQTQAAGRYHQVRTSSAGAAGSAAEPSISSCLGAESGFFTSLSSGSVGAQGSDGPGWEKLRSLLLLPLWVGPGPLRSLSEARRLQVGSVQLLQGGSGVSGRRLQGVVVLRTSELPAGLAAVPPLHAGAR